MNTFQLNISSPDGKIIEGAVLRITVRGTEGDLAVMAGHVPFITSVRPGECVLHMEDGTIRFKTYHHVGDAPLDKKAARLAVLMPFLMIDRFGDGLIDVLFGLKSPREAFEAVGQG